ncbi:hypothetical protein [Candidatus Poriferisocius sp.]|uniref:hypothetical protein n=1 Tax=Candidatus Poriferisocius sp. TaxID=3101276 RepID=UPI003B028658
MKRLLASLLLLAAACGAPDTEVETIAGDVVAPLATAEPNTRDSAEAQDTAHSSETSPAATPGQPTVERKPGYVSATCSDTYDNAGLEYEYNIREMKPAAAVGQHCGTLAPVVALCDDSYRDAGKEFRFDPDSTSLWDAADESCGEWCGEWCDEADSYLDGATCSDEWELAGTYFAYDLYEMTFEEAEAEHCGSRLSPPSNWEHIYDFNGNLSTVFNSTPFYDFHDLSSSPELHMGCPEGDLLVAIFLDDYTIFPSSGVFIPVGYGFARGIDDTMNQATYVEEDWLGNSGGGLIGMPYRVSVIGDGQTSFVRNVRSHGWLVFAALTSDGRVIGAQFELAGVGRDVEPMLQECGY